MKLRKVIGLILLLTASLSGLSSCSITGPQGPQGEQGVQGVQGEPGKDGHTPVITIGENGNWFIDGVDTGVKAQGDKGDSGAQGDKGDTGAPGADGKDGTSLLTGDGIPSNDIGINGDSYVDLSSWNYYIKTNAGWVLQGNIKGEDGQDVSSDHNGTEGLEFYPINDTECAVAVGKAKLLKEIIIPSKYKNYTVTTIYGLANDGGFQNCSVLEKITLPDTIASIGSSAFYNCSSLISIAIPNSVTSIGKYAFGNCSNLTSITIPNSVTSIGENAFYDCSSLTNVYYLGSIEDWCNIKFNSYISNPRRYASHIYMLDENNEWYEVTNIEIPHAVTSIGDYQFYGFDNVTEIIIPSTVTSIGESAFERCSSLTSITIPDSVTSIGDGAFEYCSSLTSITIPDSVTSIGEGALGGCSSLTSITIPFVGNTLNGTSNAHFGYIFGDILFVPSTLKEVIVTGGSSIDLYAFSGCCSLTSITIPNSVTSIGVEAFKNCTSLSNVYYLGTIEDWCNISFNSYNSNPMYYASHFYMLDENNEWYEVTSLEIPSTITSIGDYQFYGFDNVTEIIIPSTVTSIGKSAFSSCRNLTSIEIPNSVTSIGESAFYYCSSLTSITIPDSVTTIGSSAFASCTSLTSIVIPDSVTSIGEYAFSECSSLTIYCEASSQPEGWSSIWFPHDRPDYWAGQWEYDANGNPTPII